MFKKNHHLCLDWFPGSLTFTVLFMLPMAQFFLKNMEGLVYQGSISTTVGPKQEAFRGSVLPTIPTYSIREQTE